MTTITLNKILADSDVVTINTTEEFYTELSDFRFQPGPSSREISKNSKLVDVDSFNINIGKKYQLGSSSREINISGILVNQSEHNLGNKTIEEQKNDLWTLLEQSGGLTLMSPSTGKINVVISDISFNYERGKTGALPYEITLMEIQ